jgi:hypothetical protein
MTDDLERRIINCRIALDGKMKALVEYSNMLFNEKGRFDENNLSYCVNELQNVLRDYENAIDEYIQNRT